MGPSQPPKVDKSFDNHLQNPGAPELEKELSRQCRIVEQGRNFPQAAGSPVHKQSACQLIIRTMTSIKY
jgi:hypothetical protein